MSSASEEKRMYQTYSLERLDRVVAVCVLLVRVAFGTPGVGPARGSPLALVFLYGVVCHWVCASCEGW